MERDFLGLTGKEMCHQRTGLGGSSAMQSSQSDEVSCLQRFVSWKASHEEVAKKPLFDKPTSSAILPIPQAPQKWFTADSQDDRQFSRHAFQSGSNPPCGANEASSSLITMHQTFPGVTKNPFLTLKQQPLEGDVESRDLFCDPIVSQFTTRNVYKPLPTTAQVSIFYNGSVKVYNEVPFDKAQEIVFLASKGSNASLDASNQRPEETVSNTTTARLSSGSPVFLTTQTIHQARKKSLARFLEKRKERIASAKNPLNNIMGTDGSSRKSPATGITLPNKCERLLNPDHNCSNSIDYGDSPSTKLRL